MSRLTQILRGKSVKPLTEKEAAVKYAIDHAGSGGSDLPDVTSDDNGKVLGVSSGAWNAVYPATNVFEATATASQGESDKVVLTLNKTAAELYAAVSAGKLLKTTTTLDGGTTVVTIVSVSAASTTADSTTTYAFAYFDEEGTLYACGSLAGTDAVVFTES